MSENILHMTIGMIVAICNFWVVLMLLREDKLLAKFFVAANLVLGVMNTIIAIKYLLK